MYAISFFLVDVVGTGPGRGYWSAWLGLALPWAGNNLFGHQGTFEHKMFEYFSLLLSGWINPFFLVALFHIFRGQHQRAVTILKVVILLMIPFCWVVFRYEDFVPREGHFL